jgi:hypothetical protein
MESKADVLSIEVEIETHDRQLEWDLLGKPAVIREGVSNTFPDGSTLTWQPGALRKMHGAPQFIRFVLSCGKDVIVGVLSGYLYDKLKGRATVLRVDRQEIQIDKGEITRIITEHIEKRD